MDKERKLYDKFVDVLNDILEGEPTPKELEIVMNFLKNNNIQATVTNKGVANLTDKIMQLPFDNEDELPPMKISEVISIQDRKNIYPKRIK